MNNKKLNHNDLSRKKGDRHHLLDFCYSKWSQSPGWCLSLLRLLVLVFTLLFIPTLGQAVTYTWTDGSTNGVWDDNGNWDVGGSYPNGANHKAVIDSTSRDITMPAGGITLGELELSGTYDGILTMEDSLIIDDSGTENGNLTVNQGTLQTDEGETSNITVDGTFSIGANGTVIVRYSSLTANGNEGTGQTITASTLTVAGNMNADGQGFAQNSGPGSGASDVGATHGGVGGNNTDATYGSITNPISLGSGGRDDADGLAGGGAIIISSSGTVTIDGTLSANGLSESSQGSAGGSINITANILTGTGTISADGSNGAGSHASGGGGRISLNGVTTDNFTGTLQAHGGGFGFTNAKAGSSGTIYLNATKRANLVIGGAGNLTTLRLGTDDTNDYTFTNITIQSGGTLQIDGNPTNLNGSQGTAATINVSTLDVQLGGSLNADAMGHSRGNDTLGGPGGGASDTGATHGGEGGLNTDNTYGSIRAPIALGSAGAHNGGGAVIINSSGAVTVNGTISSDSIIKNFGGSGGSIYIRATSISGSGTVRANGANGNASHSSGGGGRVAVILSSGTTFGSINFQAYGGTTHDAGAAGTVYLEGSDDGSGQGELIINNNSVAASAGDHTRITSDVTDTSIGNVTMSNAATLFIDSGTSLTTTGTGTTLNVGAGTTLTNEGTLSLSGIGFTTTGTVDITSSANTVILTGENDAAGDTITINNLATTFHHLTINAGDGTNDVFNQSAGVVVNGNLVLSSGILDANDQALTLDGNATLSGGTLRSGTGVLNFGNAPGDAVNITSGELQIESDVLATDIVITAGTWTNTSGTISYLGTGGTFPSSITGYHNLTINSSGETFTFADVATDIDGVLTVTDGILNFDDDKNVTITDDDTSGTALSIAANGTFQNTGIGDLILGSTVNNLGTITFNSSDAAGNGISITSTAGQRNWAGGGTVSMTDVDVTDQSATNSILVISGADSGGNSNWLFSGGSLSSLSVVPASLLDSTTNNVTISFTTSNDIAPDGKITIVFPAGFDVSGVTTATSASDLNGTLSTGAAGQTVTITRGGGSTVFAGGGTVNDLIINNVTNPSVPGSTGTFTISTTDTNDTVIDMGSASGVTITLSSTSSSLSLVDSSGSDVDSYTVGSSTTGRIYVSLQDLDEDEDDMAIDTVLVTLSSTLTSDQETITLTETGINTGIFNNLSTGLTLEADNPSSLGNNILETRSLDTLTASYTDNDDGSDTSSDQATIEDIRGTFSISLDMSKGSLSRGDLLEGNLSITNLKNTTIENTDIVLNLPLGVSYIEGSSSVTKGNVSISNISRNNRDTLLTIPSINANENIEVSFKLMIGSHVHDGEILDITVHTDNG